MRIKRQGRRPTPEETEPARDPIDDLILGTVLILLGCGVLLFVAESLHHWSIAPLLFLGLSGLGAVVLGRGIARMQRLKRAADRDRPRADRTPPSRLRHVAAVAQGWVLLLGAVAAYVLYFFALWGPITPVKVLVGVALFLGAGHALQVGSPYAPRRRRRRAFEPGERAAQARAQWPLPRRVSAIGTGTLLAAVGTWQWLGFSVDIAVYPLLSHLCWIVSCALGGCLIGIALTAGRPWKRRPREERGGAMRPPVGGVSSRRER